MNMSSEENRTLAYLLSALLVLSGYSVVVYQHYHQGSFDADTITRFWGYAVLIAVAAQIVLSILMAILVTIAQAIITRDENPNILSDERDKLFELKADRIAYAVFGIGFLVAMTTLAFGMTPLVMFQVLVYALFGAGIAGLLTKMYHYRRGF